MSRVPSIPFRIRVLYRRGQNNVSLPDTWHSADTMAGVVEYRDKALASPNTFKVETYIMIDETIPGAEQTEPARVIHSSQGDRTRTRRTFNNGDINRPQR